MKTPVDSLNEGDVLASDVIERSGRLILGRGRALTARHIEVLRSWGILEVELASADAAANQSGEDDAALQQARAAVLPRFALNDPQQPLVAALIEVCAAAELNAGGAT